NANRRFPRNRQVPVVRKPVRCYPKFFGERVQVSALRHRVVARFTSEPESKSKRSCARRIHKPRGNGERLQVYSRIRIYRQDGGGERRKRYCRRVWRFTITGHCCAFGPEEFGLD